jgi:hypothetical protein
MDEYTLLFRGTPVGTVHCQFADRFGAGDVQPLPAFEPVRTIFADASRALTNLGFLPPTNRGGVSREGDHGGAAALAKAQAICDDLELRDSHGRLVPTDWINIFGGRNDDDPIGVMLTIDHELTGITALIPHQARVDSGHESPAG